MRPKLHALTMGTAMAAVLFVGAAHAAQTPVPQDCNVVPPEIEGPNADATGGAPDAGPEDSLTDLLATCGSVLNPPPVGDPDMVQPAPDIDDPMAIQPADPQKEMQ